MKTATSQLTYRLAEEKDTKSIRRLWSEESGWGDLSEAQFQDWSVHTPYGRCLIVVAATEEDEVVGQAIFSPSRIVVEGETIRSLRGSAPVVSKAFRQDDLKSEAHPAFSLVRAGLALAADAGYQVVYSFPAPGWAGLFQLFSRRLPYSSETITYDCFAISLENEKTFVLSSGKHKVLCGIAPSEEYGQLWEGAVGQRFFACAIERKPSWLRWAVGGYLNLEVRDVSNNRLIGYMSVKKESGLVVDVFARHEDDLRAVFRACVAALHLQNPARIATLFTQLKGMLTPHAKPVVESIGFTDGNYRFAFGSCLLDPGLDPEKLKPANWYLTPLG